MALVPPPPPPPPQLKRLSEVANVNTRINDIYLDDFFMTKPYFGITRKNLRKIKTRARLYTILDFTIVHRFLVAS